MVIAVRRAMVPKSVQMELQDLHVPILLNAAAIIASETNAQTVIWEMLVEALVIARMVSVFRRNVPKEKKVINALPKQIASLRYVVTIRILYVLRYVLMEQWIVLVKCSLIVSLGIVLQMAWHQCAPTAVLDLRVALIQNARLIIASTIFAPMEKQEMPVLALVIAIRISVSGVNVPLAKAEISATTKMIVRLDYAVTKTIAMSCVLMVKMAVSVRRTVIAIMVIVV
jgi:hypothetical protein